MPLPDTEYVEVNPDVPWEPGTILRINFDTVGITYLTAAQIAAAEKKLEAEKSFDVLRHSTKTGYQKDFYFEVRVREAKKSNDPRIQQAGVTGALIAKIIIAAFILGMFLYSMKSVELKVQQAAGQAAEKAGEAAERSEGFVEELGITITKAAAAAAILLVLWRHA